MSKTVALTKDANGAIYVAINGATPRPIIKPNNLTVKPLIDGVVIKKTDETWRLKIELVDTVTEGGATKSPYANVAAMVTDFGLYFSA